MRDVWVTEILEHYLRRALLAGEEGQNRTHGEDTRKNCLVPDICLYHYPSKCFPGNILILSQLTQKALCLKRLLYLENK